MCMIYLSVSFFQLNHNILCILEYISAEDDLNHLVQSHYLVMYFSSFQLILNTKADST